MLNKKKPRDRQYIYLQPGGDYVFQKPMMQKPKDHLQRFNEMIRMAETLLVGDMHPPNQVFQLERFYMSFHKEDRSKYVESGCPLVEERLESLVEYYENIYNPQVADGSLNNKRKCQARFESDATCFMSFARGLMRRFTMRQSNVTRVITITTDGLRETSTPTSSGRIALIAIVVTHTTSATRNRTTKFLLSANKAFKPCSIHGPKSKHTSEECHKNPRNMKRQFYDRKRPHEVHRNDPCYTSKEDESRSSNDAPAPSEDPVSASSGSEEHEDEIYHLKASKKMKASGHVPCKSDCPRQKNASQKGHKEEKERKTSYLFRR
jgi:hypothetical protein